MWRRAEKWRYSNFRKWQKEIDELQKVIDHLYLRDPSLENLQLIPYKKENFFWRNCIKGKKCIGIKDQEWHGLR